MTTLELRETLARQLTSPQLAMMAIGGAIGTGLFLGSALAVRTAGPGVIITYIICAVIAVLLMRALGEMAIAHPTAGSFGVYAELYVNKWSGFTVRYTYWAGQCVAIGGEATAIAIYCQWWFPNTPQWFWILTFTVALLYINARSVGSFGSFEYWFAMIKVVAIVLFIALGAALILGIVPHHAAIGFSNLTSQASGGFLPKGLGGVWLASVFVIFSYVGTEIVAVTAGEAQNPEVAIPRAMRTVAVRLLLFYVAAIFVLVTVVPWTQIQPGASTITASPFVRVFQLIGIPAAAHIINFVVVTAAASSMNCNLYLVSRMLLLARPRRLRASRLGPRFLHRHAHPCASRFCRRPNPRPSDLLHLSIARLRLFVRHLPLRRPLHVARHLHHASLLPLQAEPLAHRRRRHCRHSPNNVVGRRHAHHPHRRRDVGSPLSLSSTQSFERIQTQQRFKLPCPCLPFARWCHRRPTLCDLVSFKSPKHETVELLLLPVGACPSPNVPANHPVSLGNHLFNAQVQIGHRLVHPNHHLLIALNAGRLPARAVMVIEIRSHVRTNHGRVFAIDKVFEVIAHEPLHFICTQMGWHSCLLLDWLCPTQFIRKASPTHPPTG